MVIWIGRLVVLEHGIPRVRNTRCERFERAPEQRAQPSLRQALGERIDRGDTTEVDRTLFTRNGLGFWMVHAPWFEGQRLAEDHYFVAFCKILFHEGQVPPPAMQPRRAIVEDNLENGFFVPAEPFSAERDDSSARGDRFAKPHF